MSKSTSSGMHDTLGRRRPVLVAMAWVLMLSVVSFSAADIAEAEPDAPETPSDETATGTENVATAESSPKSSPETVASPATTPETAAARTTPPTTTPPTSASSATTTPATDPTVPSTTAAESPETTAVPDPTTAEQDDATEATAAPTSDPAQDDPPAVAPLSTGTATTFVRFPQTWWAYVGAGENLDVAIVKGLNVPGFTADVDVRVQGPGGFDQTCTIGGTEPTGTNCTFTDATSPTGAAGIWRVDFLTPDVGNTERHTWSIGVQSGTTDLPGRVYSLEYITRQFTGGPPVDQTFYYKSEQGFLYEATYRGYNGIDSSFTADATGVAFAGGCVSAYQSMDVGSTTLYDPEPGVCGDPYKIFFEQPDPNMPATATLYDDSTTDWLNPTVALPTLADLAFTPDSTTVRSGEFAFEVTNFTGQLDVEIDTNNDGDYTDPEDVTLPAAVTADGTVTVAYDGDDGLGNEVPATRNLTARVAITRVGEIHFANSDVEWRGGGLEVVALNGPAPGDTLYWDDSALSAAGKCGGGTPVPDGTGGVASTAGVHGWGVTGCPSMGNGAGHTGSWGNNRVIDDWTYHTIDEFEEIAIPGELPPPFECTSTAYLFQSAPTDVSAVDLVTGVATPVADDIYPLGINADGFNPLDGYIYGSASTEGIVRTGSDFSPQLLGYPSNWGDYPFLQANFQHDIGEFATDGTYWVAWGGDPTVPWAQIDLDINSPTYMEVLSAGEATKPDSSLVISDWAYNVEDGNLYTVTGGGGSPQRALWQMDTATGVLSEVADLGTIGDSPSTFGAQYADADGFMYVSKNDDGNIWRIDLSTLEVEFFTTGPSASANDGARCVEASTLIDLGDAPNVYGTALADDGPRHGIPGYQEANGTAPLMLGAAIDVETDGQPGPAADGDGGDEDGVADPIVMVDGQPTTVSVEATNTTGEPATLVGWIDLNGDGDFDDAGERQEIAVPAGSTGVDFDLMFDPATFAGGGTYARFRLFPDSTDPADTLPTGPAAAGEVEDYPVEGPVLPPFECGTNAPGLLLAGGGFQGIDMVTGEAEPLVNITGYSLNAFGYNVLDDYVYGWDEISQQVVRVGSDGTVDELGVPTGMPAADLSKVWRTGDVDDNGHYWLYENKDGEWYDIDLATMTVSATGLASTTVEGGADWAYIPGTDSLYRVPRNAGGSASFLMAFNRTTHTWSTAVPLGDLGGPGSDNQVGAVYADADGFVYASYFFTGQIWRIDPATGTAVHFATTGQGQQDGARCPDSPILIDFGDAPDSYGTELASNGPRHGVKDYNEQTGEAPLVLGASIDSETDGAPSPDADGDDTTDADDEDGVANPIVLVDGQSTTVSVEATNTTGAPATLVGWIDLNGDGDFDDAGERQEIAVPAGSTGVDFDLMFDPATFAGGGTYARFRLFPDSTDPADMLPTGPASAGEVEDYVVDGPVQPPFECVSNAPGLLFQYAAGGDPTDMHEIDLVTGAPTTPETAEATSVNAIGYNVLDNYVYGWDTDGHQLVRVGADGSIDNSITQPADIPSSRNFLVGDVDDQGHYWVFARNADTWHDIDLGAGTSTSDTAALPAGLTAGFDWAHIPGTDTLWMIARNASDDSVLIGLNRTTGSWTPPVNLGSIGNQLGTVTDPGVVGAIFVDDAGHLYASYNDSGEIWRIDVTAEEAVFFSPGPSSSNNDGARCPDSPVLIDLGDAPDGYDTTLAEGGPRHGIPDYDPENNDAPLMIGPSIDPEDDGAPSPDADGDDTTDADDEDGIANPIVMTDGAQTTVTVNATNTTGAAATLVGWIDNPDGTFDVAEMDQVTVPAGSMGVDFDLTFDPPTFVGDTYARFRLFPDSTDPADMLPTGPAAAGEVEDYPVTGPVLPPLECGTNAPGYLFQSPEAGEDMTGYAIDLVTGESPEAMTIPDTGSINEWMNAFAYNTLDGYFYAWHSVQNFVVRVGADGNWEQLDISGIPASNGADGGYNIGDIDENGHLWLSHSRGDPVRWVQIDLANLTVIETGTNGGEITNFDGGADWAHIPGTDSLYRVVNDPVTGEEHLFAFNRTTKNYSNLGNLNDLAPGNFGAVYADDEFLYASSNDTGEIYRIDVDAATGTFFAQGPASNNNDGARCPTPILIDFGDARDGYGTELASGGPRHGIKDYNDQTGTAPLMLGPSIDAETDGVPSPDADGDDTTDADDEDGVANPIVMTDGAQTTVTVSATNTSGAPATLVGWIDLNGDGDFGDAGERQEIAVPAGSSGVDFDLMFDPPTAFGDTYARFRLFPDSTDPADMLPTGPASAGEVEDYTVEGPVLEPWECGSNAAGILFQRESGVDVTDGSLIDMVTGEFETPLELDGYDINAIGYNVFDDYVYGWDRASTPHQIVRVGSDGNVESLGLPDQYPVTVGSNIGDVDENGHYWFMASVNGERTWFQVDMDETSPTFMDVLASGRQQGDGINNFQPAVDWAYVPGGGDYLYTVVGNSNRTSSVLYRFDRSSGLFDQVGSLGSLADNLFGAMYADADGFLYLSSNQTGDMFRVDVHAATATPFADGPWSSGNDGARCADSSILIDFGDAPDGYGTELASDGARHGIKDYDENNGKAPLMIGTSIDAETDGAPSLDADGDDTTEAGDEDGVAGPIVMVDRQPTNVTVSATNTSGAPATLVGWIDLNADGDFDDTGERQGVPVPAGSQGVDFDLAFPVGTATADTYARFRLFPDGTDPADMLPTGPAAAGEVEDYPVTVQLEPPPVECPAGSVLIPVELIQNPSYESRTADFVNDDADNTIQFAEDWHDSHPTGGQYHYFSPTFDSGPGPASMPVRSGAHGYAFLGGHSDRGNGEGATNTLAEPLVAGETYVGYFSMAAGGYNRQGDGFMRFFGTSDPDVGHIGSPGNVVPATATNTEALFDTPVVEFPGVGVTPQWEQHTFSLTPTQAWDYLRVEVRNEDPATDVAVEDQVWMNFDDFHMFRCEPQHTKELIDVAPNGDGTYTASYELTVTRSAVLGDGTYDLTDTLMYGDGVTIEAVRAANVTPGGLPVEGAFDGQGNTLVANDVPIGAGDTHVYTVEVDISIDTDTITFESSDCELGTNESGTGLFNESAVEIDGETVTDDTCELPPAEPGHDKEVTSGPTPIGNGQYEIEYTITVTNDMAAAGEYDLTDELRYGDGVTITSGPSITATPGTITPEANWNGDTNTVIVTDQPIGGAADASNPTVHTYVVSVEVEVAADITIGNADCDLQIGGGDGTGFLNTATMDVNGEVSEEDACPVVPVTEFDKQLVDRVSNGDGTYTLVYELIVTRTGDGPGYDLDDTLRYGGAVSVDDVRVPSAPGAATVNTGFDGETDTRVASNVPIADGGVHTYEVEVDVTVDGDQVTFENSNCQLGQGENGTGFSNEAAVVVNGTEITDDACEGFPFTEVDKQTTSEPSALPNGNYQIEYTITATNKGAAPGTYDLTDELQYGAGINVVNTQVSNTQPGTITTRSEWNGESDTLVIENQRIGAATAQGPAVHEYLVTVEVNVPAGIDPGDADCDPQTGGPGGTGFLNEATVAGESGPSNDTDCPPTPRTDFDKELMGKSPNGDGTYTLSYELTVSREGTDGTYDLSDELLLSDAVSVVNGPFVIPPAAVDPADLESNFDGEANTLIIGGQAIAAGDTHVYTMDVVVEVDLDAVTPENSDCALTQGEAGTGAMNQATLTIDNQTYEGEDCEPFPGTTVDKDIASGPTAMGGGEYGVTYEITVTNSGAAGDTYDVEDELNFGGDISIVSTNATNTQPGGLTVEGTWDGEGATLLVDDQSIGGATTGIPTVHVYEVTVVVEAPPDIAVTDADCTLQQGETGTGLLNEVTVTGEAGESTDDACPVLPSTDFDKNVVGDVVDNGDGTYTVTYELLVSRTGDGPAYDLVDAFQYGDAVTVEGDPQVTAPPAVDASHLNSDYDGEGDTLVADDVPIGDGDTHRYEVAVPFSIDAELVTFENSDCTLGTNETGTGLLNEASVEVNNTTIDAEECPTLPAEPLIDKTITSDPPTPVGNGRYEITYQITATNNGASDGVYTLDDELLYGDGITVVNAQVINSDPGNITPNTNWNGEDRIRVVTDEPIAAGTAQGPEVHVYEVTVVAEVAADITIGNADCDPQSGGPDGTGFLNEATLSANGEKRTDEDCVRAPVTDIDKELVDVTPNGDGTYTLDYEITVTRTGDGPGYDLDDTLEYGDAVTVDSVTASNIQPGGITTNTDFDGESDTRIATNVPIADGDTHLYEVQVETTVDVDQATFANSDCDVGQGEAGTGFRNTASVTTNGSTAKDRDCEEFPAIDVDKSTVGTPTPLGGGRFEIVYTIDAVNKGAGQGTYNLDDELLYGDGITVLDASVTNTIPGGIATEANWDGDSNLRVVTGETIAGATNQSSAVHTYEVTVEVEVDGDLAPEAADCDLQTGGSDGTGFLNRATLTGDSGERIDENCPPAPVTEFDKELVDIVPLQGRQFELVYEITVERVQGGDGTYTVTDELMLGESLTIDGVTAGNTDPGGITTNPDFDGVDDIVVAANKPISDGETHLYEVRAVVTVDIGAVTPGNSDCQLGGSEPGTGTMNEATLNVDGVEPDPVEDCKRFPSTTHFKDVVDGPTAIGDGKYEIGYEIMVVNAGAAPDEYDLDDTLRFGDGVTIESATVSNTGQGTIATNPDWDGIDDIEVVTDEPIAAGTDQGPAIHTYRVDVVADAPAGIDPAAADCTVDPGESGTGFANESSLTVGPDTETDDACEEVPITDIDKELVDVTENDDGTYTLDYDLVVTRTGDGGGPYRLVDELQYGDAVTIESITATNIQPGGITINQNFDGVDDIVVAQGVPIADGDTHLYQVQVVASVDADSVTFQSSSCPPPGGGSNGGFLNEARVTSNGVTARDDTCDPNKGGVRHAKEVTSGPTHLQGNRYEIEYTVTVVNHGAADDTYTLDDEFNFGDGTSIVSARVANATPGGLATNPNWNGQGRTRVATDQPIAGAEAGSPTTHTYTVTVVVDVADGVAPDAADCEVGPDGAGSGFLNLATMTVNGEQSTDDACEEVPGDAQLEIIKTTGVTSADYDDTVDYTVTVENTGAVDFTEDSPAVVVDDLADVLDDAGWVGDAEASVGSLSYSEPELTWTGPLAVGDTATISYTVTVTGTGTGNGDLYNAVSSNTGDNNCSDGSSDPNCETNTPIIEPPDDPSDPPAPTAPPSPVTPDPVPVTG